MRSHPVPKNESAFHRRRGVVGMTLQLSRQGQHVGVELEQMVGSQQTREHRRRACAETAGQRNARRDRELKTIRGRERLESPDHQVRAVAGNVEVGVDRERASLEHLELEMQR